MMWNNETPWFGKEGQKSPGEAERLRTLTRKNLPDPRMSKNQFCKGQINITNSYTRDDAVPQIP
jgi:hypothetical protein